MSILKSNFWQLSRVFLPHWGFFDIIGDDIQLYIEIEQTRKIEVISFLYDIKLSNLFFNQYAHFAMLQKNVVEHFVSDLQNISDQGEVYSLSSYKILSQILKNLEQVKENNFRFIIKIKNNNHIDYQNYFQSDWIRP